MEAMLINCAAVLGILVFSSLTVLMLIGNGYLALSLLKVDSSDSPISTISIIGFIFICTILNLAHFYFPINAFISFGVFALGLAFAYFDRRKIISGILGYKKILKSYTAIFGISLVVFIVISRSLEVPSNPDSAGYHLASIGWINRFHLIPGLANLHFRFGFNNLGYFNYPALFNFYPIFSRGYVVASVSIIIVTYLCILRGLLTSDGQSSLKKGPIIWILVLAITLNLRYIDSPTPDLIVFLLEIVIFFSLFSYFFEIQSVPQKTTSKLLVIGLSTLLITFKLSSVFYTLISILLVLLPTSNINKINISKVFFIVITIIAPYIIRGYWLSGYPLFPNPSLAYETLEWLVPKSVAINESNWIYSWARAPGLQPSEVLNSWNWFFPWVLHIKFSNWVLMSLSLISTLINIIHFKTIKKYFDATLFALMAQCIISIVMWFYLAPDFRFLGSILWIYLSLSIALNSNCLNNLDISANVKPLILNASKAFGLMIFAITFAKSMDLRYMNFSGFQEIPIPAHSIRQTGKDLTLQIPRDGSCWMESGACTPYFNENLKLIEIKKFESGFAISK
jgi:hypothetical protein